MDGREVPKVRRPTSEMWARRPAEASGLITGAIEDVQSVQQSFDDGRVLYRSVVWAVSMLALLCADRTFLCTGDDDGRTSLAQPLAATPVSCFCFPRCAGR